jgi:neutral ceramidase
VDNKNTAIHFDNKGHASALFEAKYPGVVAMFAQEKAGDVSPNYHGPKGKAGRRARRSRSADHGFALALNNGGMQAGLAEKLLTAPSGDTLSAVIDHELIYVNMANTAVDPDLANGLPDARTAPACHGMAFTCGTPVDGKGAPRWVLQIGHFFAFKRDRRQGDEQRAVLAPQGPKKIMTNAHNGTFLGRYPDRSWTTKLAFKDLKRQGPYMRSNPLVQEVVPVQLFIIGELCIVGLPAEITTHAGDQLVEVVRQALAERGVKRVVIASYANAYVGYVTTYEEYQAQTYEGGHTLFGEWELGAFQTEFRRMARAMLNPDRTKRALDRSTRHRYETKELCGRSFPGSCAACRE